MTLTTLLILTNLALVVLAAWLFARTRPNRSQLLQAQEERETAQRFRQAFQASPVPCAIATLDEGRYVEINASYTECFGWLPEDVIDRTTQEVELWETPGDRAVWLEALKNNQGRLVNYETRWRDKAGATRIISLSCGSLDIHGIPHVMSFCTDITDRCRTEAEIQQYRQQLESLVRERTQALESALHQAENASRAKSTFLTNISHELRTPINAIQGFIHLAAATATDHDQRQRLERAGMAADGLAAMIASLIDLSRIEGNAMTLETEDFSTQAMFDQVLRVARTSAQAKGFMVHFESPANFPAHLRGDGHRLTQILNSLLSNAIKFTERGQINLRTSHVPLDNGAIRIRCEVEDTGMGIPLYATSRIFEPFEQADGSITRRHGGIGINLALCRTFARLMGGDIGVTSTPGQGSTFWFVVVMQPAQGSAAPAVQPVPGTSPAAAVEELPPALATIDGLDTQMGLTSLRGKVTSYLRLLRQYADHHGTDIAAARQALDEDNWEEARRLVHSLKGASGTLGIVHLRQIAAEAENAIKTHADRPTINALLANVEASYRNITQQILAALPSDLQKPTQAIPTEAALAVLTRLEALLDDDNVSSIAAARENESILLPLLGAKHAVFANHLENFDFEPALAILREARQNHQALRNAD